MTEFKLIDFIKDTYPVSTISLIIIFSAFIKVSIACTMIIRFQERRIEFLEKQLEGIINGTN